jgi:hypothetical protein
VAQLYPQEPSTHFSRLLRHAWATVGLFFSRVTTRGTRATCSVLIVLIDLSALIMFVEEHRLCSYYAVTG